MGKGYIIEYDTNPVPIPAAFWLLGSGLTGLAGMRRKFKHYFFTDSSGIYTGRQDLCKTLPSGIHY